MRKLFRPSQFVDRVRDVLKHDDAVAMESSLAMLASDIEAAAAIYAAQSYNRIYLEAMQRWVACARRMLKESAAADETAWELIEIAAEVEDNQSKNQMQLMTIATITFLHERSCIEQVAGCVQHALRRVNGLNPGLARLLVEAIEFATIDERVTARFTEETQWRLRVATKPRMKRWERDPRRPLYRRWFKELELFPDVASRESALDDVDAFVRSHKVLGVVLALSSVVMFCLVMYLSRMAIISRSVVFVTWLLIMLGMPFVIVVLLARKIRRLLRRSLNSLGILLCVECGYDMRSLETRRCPECGWIRRGEHVRADA